MCNTVLYAQQHTVHPMLHSSVLCMRRLQGVVSYPRLVSLVGAVLPTHPFISTQKTNSSAS